MLPEKKEKSKRCKKTNEFVGFSVRLDLNMSESLSIKREWRATSKRRIILPVTPACVNDSMSNIYE